MAPDQIVAWAGLVIGLAFGVCGQITGFCLKRGLAGWWVEGEGTKIRALGLALAVALVGAQALDAAGLVALRTSLYMQPEISVLTLAAGGVLFGYGMVMANGCGARALVLLGSGNLRSFVVLVCLGIAGAATLTGLVAPLRTAMQSVATLPAPVSPASLPAWLATAGLDGTVARWLVVALMSGGLMAFAFLHAPFRKDAKAMASGFIVGLLVVMGWYATGVLGADDFDPAALESLTFIAPVANTINFLMLATGFRLSFGVAVVIGVFLGALGSALVTRTGKLEGFTRPGSMLRYMGGGTLMGLGGAMALGCNIGQGLTGLSTLALGSFIASGGILLGAWFALRGPGRLPAPRP